MGCIQTKASERNDSAKETLVKGAKLNTVVIESAPETSVDITNEIRDQRSFTDVRYLDKNKSESSDRREKLLKEI